MSSAIKRRIDGIGRLKDRVLQRDVLFGQRKREKNRKVNELVKNKELLLNIIKKSGGSRTHREQEIYNLLNSLADSLAIGTGVANPQWNQNPPVHNDDFLSLFQKSLLDESTNDRFNDAHEAFENIQLELDQYKISSTIEGYRTRNHEKAEKTFKINADNLKRRIIELEIERDEAWGLNDADRATKLHAKIQQLQKDEKEALDLCHTFQEKHDMWDKDNLDSQQSFETRMKLASAKDKKEFIRINRKLQQERLANAWADSKKIKKINKLHKKLEESVDFWEDEWPGIISALKNAMYNNPKKSHALIWAWVWLVGNIGSGILLTTAWAVSLPWVAWVAAVWWVGWLAFYWAKKWWKNRK